MSTFRSAIVGDDGEVDAGYLALYWSLIGWSVSSIIILILGTVSVAVVMWAAVSSGGVATVIVALAKDHPEQIAPIVQAMVHTEQIAPIIQSTGVALGAVAAAFATVVGAVGLFRAGDKSRAPIVQRVPPTSGAIS